MGTMDTSGLRNVTMGTITANVITKLAHNGWAVTEEATYHSLKKLVFFPLSNNTWSTTGHIKGNDDV